MNTIEWETQEGEFELEYVDHEGKVEEDNRGEDPLKEEEV
jgi:hypothetical protein